MAAPTVLINAGERDYIAQGILANVRNDGRQNMEYRHFFVSTSPHLLPGTYGAARVRLGLVTEVLVGVKAEVVEPDLQRPDKGKISFSVDW